MTTTPVGSHDQLACPTCLYRTSASTARLAEWAFRQHVCARHQPPQPKPGESMPCTHGGRHPHGSPARYSHDRCRCRACRRAIARVNEVRRAARAAGVTPWVAPVLARRHVQRLRVAGMSIALIADAARCSTQTVVHVLAETTTRIKATTASRLLAIKPAVHPGHRVTGPGPARRLQALAVLGWGPPALSERSGVAANTLAEVRSAVRCPTAQTAAVIRVLFDELWDQRPPVDTYARQQSVRTTLATARRHQWVPALAWDDIDTDAFPAQVVDERVTTTEEASFLARAGVGLTETARRLGVQPESVMEAMRRADRPDLAALLRHNDTRSAA